MSEPTSWACEVGTVSCQDDVWTANGCRYPTKESAELAGRDKWLVWTAMTRYRAVESADPVNMNEDGSHKHVATY